MKIKLFTLFLFLVITQNNSAQSQSNWQFSLNFSNDKTSTQTQSLDLYFSDVLKVSPFIACQSLINDTSQDKKSTKVSYSIDVVQSFTGLTITVKRNGGPSIVPYVIQNNMGRDLAQGELNYSGTEVETTINISSISKGSYSITVGEGSESSTAFFQVK